jgi:hypothetical protein
MRHAMMKGLAAGALVLLALPGILMAQQHGHGHGEREGPMRGMMQHAMDDCPMAAGMMEAVLHYADELELTGDQIARFEELRERYEDGHPAMREVMGAVHETLTPEQMQALRETFHGHMAGMMHGRMMGPMMHGEGHRMHEGRMGAHAEECPMMRRGPGEGHRHPR